MSSRTAATRSSKGRTDPRRRRRDELGTSTVEFAIITPVFLLLIFTLIQAGLYYHARNAAESSAREGVSYLRLAGDSPDLDAFMDAAEAVSENYAVRVGELENVDAVAHLDEDEGRVWIEVSGDAVLPLGGTVRITQTSYATLEQFRPDTRESS